MENENEKGDREYPKEFLLIIKEMINEGNPNII